jgi:hypothetical protein
VSKKHPEEPVQQHESIIQPIIDDLKEKPTTHFPAEDEDAPPSGPPKPAALDQDAGGGYNSNGTFPQT